MHDSNSIQVFCDYKFTSHSSDAEAIESAVTYLLLYEISGGESASDSDLKEFARANGALHSWPFVRGLLFGLTSRMGYPPYTLPVMHFNTGPSTTAETATTDEMAVSSSN